MNLVVSVCSLSNSSGVPYLFCQFGKASWYMVHAT